MLYAVTTHFNPYGYQSRRDNYRIFRQNLNAPLISIELGFDGRFDLTENDAEILIRVGDGDVMFQKERLLNLVFEQHLPDDCDFVAWLDCDIIFSHRNWRRETARLLEHHHLVQMFGMAHRRNTQTRPGEPVDEDYLARSPSFAKRWKSGEFDWTQYDRTGREPYCRYGLAWAARREVLDRVPLYDACVIGSGDRAIPSVITGNEYIIRDHCSMSGPRLEHFREWAERFRAAADWKVTYLPGVLIQLWHGDYRHRHYTRRHDFFGEVGFNPAVDLRLGSDGAWKWQNSQSPLARYVAEYFRSRKEDGEA